MFALNWFIGGLVSGMIISAVFVPPTRIESKVPTPNDNTIYKTATGCVKVKTTEVPCVEDFDSLNLIASKL
jgi:hypothetical protein